MDIRYIILFLLIIPVVSASSIRINEVMYNPIGDEYDFEYIELYGEEEDIFNWSFGGIRFSFPLNTSIKGYLVIATSLNDFLDRYPDVNCNFEYTGSLVNTGELISLWNGSELIDALHYYPDWGAEDNGKSLCFINNTWKECSATPGSKNIENLIDYTIKINEFLPNPLGDDDALMPGGEWIELYNYGEEDLDLEGIKVYDSGSFNLEISNTNTLDGTIIRNKDYLVVYNSGKYRGFLNNEGFEKINLYKDNNLIDSVSYSDSELGVSFSKVENNWVKSLPTPNKENEPILNIEQDYTNLKINELFPNPKGYDNAAMPKGEFVELYNSGDSTLDLENLSFKDDYGKDRDIFISDSNTISGTIINHNSYLVVYMNGRSGFLNNDGFERISLYRDDYLLDDVSYSGSTEGLTWSKVEDKWILSLPTPGSQNYNNESDITISNIKIDKLYDLGKDNIAKFGQMIRVKLLVYKGNTNKEVITLHIKNENGDKISKDSKINVNNKFTNYTFTIPIQIIPNCKGKFKEGIYDIIVSGLDDKYDEEIEIEGITDSLCEIIKEYKETIKMSVGSSSDSSSESVLKGDYITGNVIYEGKSEKQGTYAVYFFCFSLITLIIFLLWKNE